MLLQMGVCFFFLPILYYYYYYYYYYLLGVFLLLFSSLPTLPRTSKTLKEKARERQRQRVSHLGSNDYETMGSEMQKQLAVEMVLQSETMLKLHHWVLSFRLGHRDEQRLRRQIGLVRCCCCSPSHSVIVLRAAA
jgi:hypothetical protein